ncbi:MAG: flagellar assembly peptidoglycan hydrolase FlgJ [Steroidobacteraceae bacterium]
MTLPIAESGALADAGNLTALQQAAAAHNPQALKQAAQQFESLFTGMVLKSMREANFGDSLFGSDQEDMYQDMYDDQIASEISKGRGLGLADRLVQQLARSGLPGTAQGSSKASGSSGSPDSPSGAKGAAGGSGASGTGGSASSDAATTTSSTASTCPSTARQLQFAQSLWPEAQQAAKQLGVSPVSLVAQAALETDWGRSMPRATGGSSSNNLFGIKAGTSWSGGSVQSTTQEYDSGTASVVKAQFRSYGSSSQCFQDYVSMLQNNPRYAGALGTGANTQAFGAALQRGGYATDPTYASKLGAVATTLTRTLTQALQGASGGGYSTAGALKSATSLPTTSGSNTL